MAIKISELPEEARRKLDHGARRQVKAYDADQARRLAAKLMVVLTENADTKQTQRKALALVARWMSIR